MYGNIYDDALEILKFFFKDKQIEDFLIALSNEKCKNNPLSITDLEIKGGDILPLCKGDFSKVGKTLEFLLEQVLDNPELNKKDKLIEIATKELQ